MSARMDSKSTASSLRVIFNEKRAIALSHHDLLFHWGRLHSVRSPRCFALVTRRAIGERTTEAGGRMPTDVDIHSARLAYSRTPPPRRCLLLRWCAYIKSLSERRSRITVKSDRT